MVTLNRASRKAAQASQKNAASHDRTGHSCERPGVHEDGRRQAERDQVGERVELQAERRGGARSPRDDAVGDVEHDRDRDEGGRDGEVAVEGEHHRREPAHHVQRRERARERAAGPARAWAAGAARRPAAPVGETEPPAVEDATGGPGTAGLVTASPGRGPRPAGDDGLAGHDAVAGRHEQVALGRHEDVHPGAELHQAHPLAGGELVTLADPGDDPPRHQADDLAEVHPAQLVAAPAARR